MKKIFFLKTIALSLLLVTFVNVANAQSSVFNTVTGQVTNANYGQNTTPVSPLAFPAWTSGVDNGWNSYTISSIGASGSNYYAQSFIATVSSITKFGVVIRQGSAVGKLRIGITTDNGGVPNYASPLYMGSLITPTTTGAWYYETGVNIPVTKGQKYYVLIDGYNIAGTSGWDYIGLSYTCPIPGEGIIWSNNGGVGSWQTAPGSPLAIYVEGPAAVPVPLWTIVLAFVVIGITTLIAIRRKHIKAIN